MRQVIFIVLALYCLKWFRVDNSLSRCSTKPRQSILLTFISFNLPLNFHLSNHLFAPLIARCLAKRPRDRYPSFAAISSELKRLYTSLTGKSYRARSKEEMNAAEHTNFAASYMNSWRFQTGSKPH